MNFKCAALFITAMIMLFSFSQISSAVVAPLPDTGQTKCYDNEKEIACPSPGEPFFGQDAQYQGIRLNFVDNGNHF